MIFSFADPQSPRVVRRYTDEAGEVLVDDLGNEWRPIHPLDAQSICHTGRVRRLYQWDMLQ